MEVVVYVAQEDGEISETSSVLSEVESLLFTDFDIDRSEVPSSMQDNPLPEEADHLESDTLSELSEIPSEFFADLDFDRSFLALCSGQSLLVTDTTPGGSRDRDLNQYTGQVLHRSSNSASSHEISLRSLSTNYQRNAPSMSEASTTIVVDISPRARNVPRTPAKRRGSASRKGSPSKKSTPNKKDTPVKKRTPSRRDEPQLNSKQRVGPVWNDAETETEEEEEEPSPVGTRRGSRTRKRKRAFDSDELYDEDYTQSIDQSTGGEEPKVDKSMVKRRKAKGRAPVMGKFNISGRPDIGTASSNKQDSEPTPVEEEDDPWEAEPFQKEYEESMRAKIRGLKQLISFTEFPPPSDWYAGVPTENSQWTVCVRPPKPTWYHPEWDTERRKQADKATAELVRKGEEVLRHDERKRRYRHPKSDVNFVTVHTVTWYQCHWFTTGKRWVFNISLDGYDEY